ncbi:hypothetical protein BBBOND_0300240 [Babesia bigemina]|uniref:Uncharacterized protein n=1 Tax=Babesia bigemina TaxID=5866 RepID=A0A061DB24_BABBI|nr:hypothetical protein BBBOND_0300240 [Babesia bigemina]CDR96119.1 hypothetical protein BBBOND_0300240 [Babesia bigemina]|eukprot:XP_012768305.1 hypothetical protein BBBOND_0300240 [Babesia bigemina]
MVDGTGYALLWLRGLRGEVVEGTGSGSGSVAVEGIGSGSGSVVVGECVARLRGLGAAVAEGSGKVREDGI